MKEQWVKQFSAGEKVSGLFSVADLSSARTKNDKLYLRFKAIDRTGSIESKLWDEELAKECLSQLANGDIIQLIGIVEAYNQQLQLNVKECRCFDGEYDLEDFLPASPVSAKALQTQLESAITSVKNVFMHDLLRGILTEPFLTQYSNSPAAQNVHHAYVRGLLEHSLEVARFCWVFASQYPAEVDRDLLTTGALIHDMGKVDEYQCLPGFPIVERARLTGGHIVMGRDRLKAEIAQLESFPEALALVLEHMLVSHHGLKEWGALEEPSTVEAIILSQADLASARINQAVNLVRQAGDSEWTEYNSLMRRKLWIPNY
ncbi:MAG: HD domain-containing protein [Bacillota bacterium]|nr:HD domain-containing protein [Bacillota bacterium]